MNENHGPDTVAPSFFLPSNPSDRTMSTSAKRDAAEGRSVAVVQVDPMADPAWDEKLRPWPDACIFHTAAWARVLNATYGFKPCYLTLTADRRTVSILPLMEVDSWVTGRRGVALPFTDACTPLAEDSAGLGVLYREARRHGQVRHWKRIEYRAECSGASRANSAAPYVGHRLDLSGDEVRRFRRMHSGARGAVRKATRHGVTCTTGTDVESVQAFYRLFCATRKRLGVPPQPFRFFASIQREVLARDGGFVVLAWHHGVPIAGAVFFHFGRTATYKFAASNATGRSLGASNLVLWEAICHYASRGLRVLDLGRTAQADEGLKHFKRALGATEYGLDYANHDPRQGGRIEPSSLEVSLGWSRWAFKKLPVVVLRFFGSLLYRHMAAFALYSQI